MYKKLILFLLLSRSINGMEKSLPLDDEVKLNFLQVLNMTGPCYTEDELEVITETYNLDMHDIIKLLSCVHKFEKIDDAGLFLHKTKQTKQQNLNIDANNNKNNKKSANSSALLYFKSVRCLLCARFHGQCIFPFDQLEQHLVKVHITPSFCEICLPTLTYSSLVNPQEHAKFHLEELQNSKENSFLKITHRSHIVRKHKDEA